VYGLINYIMDRILRIDNALFEYRLNNDHTCF
jgi:hypothetical protein